MTTSLANLGVVEDLERAKRFHADVFRPKLLFEDGSSAAFDFGDTMIDVLSDPRRSRSSSPRPSAGSRRDRG